MKYKIGDKVRIIGGYWGDYNGMTGTVSCVEPHGVSVDSGHGLYEHDFHPDRMDMFHGFFLNDEVEAV